MKRREAREGGGGGGGQRVDAGVSPLAPTVGVLEGRPQLPFHPGAVAATSTPLAPPPRPRVREGCRGPRSVGWK